MSSGSSQYGKLFDFGHAIRGNSPPSWFGSIDSSESSVRTTGDHLRRRTLSSVACVGETNPLKLDTAFDDRHVMVSNELNLRNNLLLADDQDWSPGHGGSLQICAEAGLRGIWRVNRRCSLS